MNLSELIESYDGISDKTRLDLIEITDKFIEKEGIEPNERSLKGLLFYLAECSTRILPSIIIDSLGNYLCEFVIDFNVDITNINGFNVEEEPRLYEALPYPIAERMNIRIGFRGHNKYHTNYYVRNCGTFCKIAFREGVEDQTI